MICKPVEYIIVPPEMIASGISYMVIHCGQLKTIV